MTPKQLNMSIQAYLENKKESYELNVYYAYLNAVLQRSEKIPKYQDLIKEQKEQTPETMLEELKRINIEMGGNTY